MSDLRDHRSRRDRQEREIARKMDYVFGSSTPREFTYLPIPHQYRIYDTKLRRRHRKGEPTLADYMKEARLESATRPRDRSLDSSLRRLFAFGSSTPREWDYLQNVSPSMRVYDVRLSPASTDDKRSKTTSFSSTGSDATDKRHRGTGTSSSERQGGAKKPSPAPNRLVRSIDSSQSTATKPPRPAAVRSPSSLKKAENGRKVTSSPKSVSIDEEHHASSQAQMTQRRPEPGNMIGCTHFSPHDDDIVISISKDADLLELILPESMAMQHKPVGDDASQVQKVIDEKRNELAGPELEKRPLSFNEPQRVVRQWADPELTVDAKTSATNYESVVPDAEEIVTQKKVLSESSQPPKRSPLFDEPQRVTRQWADPELAAVAQTVPEFVDNPKVPNVATVSAQPYHLHKSLNDELPPPPTVKEPDVHENDVEEIVSVASYTIPGAVETEDTVASAGFNIPGAVNHPTEIDTLDSAVSMTAAIYGRSHSNDLIGRSNDEDLLNFKNEAADFENSRFNADSKERRMSTSSSDSQTRSHSPTSF